MNILAQFFNSFKQKLNRLFHREEQPPLIHPQIILPPIQFEIPPAQRALLQSHLFQVESIDITPIAPISLTGFHFQQSYQPPPLLLPPDLAQPHYSAINRDLFIRMETNFNRHNQEAAREQANNEYYYNSYLTLQKERRINLINVVLELSFACFNLTGQALGTLPVLKILSFVLTGHDDDLDNQQAKVVREGFELFYKMKVNQPLRGQRANIGSFFSDDTTINDQATSDNSLRSLSY